jgi:hypothetical protein
MAPARDAPAPFISPGASQTEQKRMLTIKNYFGGIANVTGRVEAGAAGPHHGAAGDELGMSSGEGADPMSDGVQGWSRAFLLNVFSGYSCGPT